MVDATNPSSRRSSASDADIRRAIKRLRKLHTIGCQCIEQLPQRMPHGQLDSIAKASGLRGETLNKARQFASPAKGGYTQRQLQRLCAQIERRGWPIGFSHIIRLLSVPKEQRQPFQDTMFSQRWSAARLGREIKSRFGTRRSGARRLSPPVDEMDLRGQLLAQCDRWRRWHRMLQSPQSTSGRKRPDEATFMDWLDKRTRSDIHEIARICARIEHRLQPR